MQTPSAPHVPDHLHVRFLCCETQFPSPLIFSASLRSCHIANVAEAATETVSRNGLHYSAGREAITGTRSVQSRKLSVSIRWLSAAVDATFNQMLGKIVSENEREATTYIRRDCQLHASSYRMSCGRLAPTRIDGNLS